MQSRVIKQRVFHFHLSSLSKREKKNSQSQNIRMISFFVWVCLCVRVCVFTHRCKSRALIHSEVSSHFFLIWCDLVVMGFLLRFMTAERGKKHTHMSSGKEATRLEDVVYHLRLTWRQEEWKKRGSDRGGVLTFLSRASAVSGAGSGTFGRFAQGSYLPPEDEALEESADGILDKQCIRSSLLWLLQKKKWEMETKRALTIAVSCLLRDQWLMQRARLPLQRPGSPPSELDATLSATCRGESWEKSWVSCNTEGLHPELRGDGMWTANGGTVWF